MYERYICNSEVTKRLGIDISEVAAFGDDYNDIEMIKAVGMGVEEREKIVRDSLGNISANCDGCMAGLADMYQDYIDGKRELRQRSDSLKCCRPSKL